MTYFALLELPQGFSLDLAQLETAYFRQQQLYHPDRFAAKPVAERQAAMQRSMDINKAYQILKDPLSRAQYLLKLQGILVGGEQDSVKPSPQLLMEVMEWRESPNVVTREKLLEMQERTIESIARAYPRGVYDEMAQDTLRLGYIVKTLETMKPTSRIAV